jgi:hypothetical protein
VAVSEAAAAPKRTLRLRTRVTLFFSVATLAASLALAVVTYAVARNYLIDQRTSVARTQGFSNANAIRTEMRAPESTDLQRFLVQLPETEGFSILITPENTVFTDQRFPDAILPDDLVTNVKAGNYGLQRFEANDDPYLGVGIYIAEFDSLYFEGFPLATTDSTLGTIATALLVGAGVTALIAGFIGWWTNRRLLRPLTRVAAAAGAIASGGLDAWRRRPTPTSRNWRTRSTTWPTPCRPGSNEKLGSRATSATSCAHRSRRSPLPWRCSTAAGPISPTAHNRRSTWSSRRSGGSTRW